MKKKPSRKSKATPRGGRNTLRPQYDFSKGVRGKYSARLKPGSQLVVLEPDVAAAFGNAKAVNRALRGLPDGRRRSRHELRGAAPPNRPRSRLVRRHSQFVRTGSRLVLARFGPLQQHFAVDPPPV